MSGWPFARPEPQRAAEDRPVHCQCNLDTWPARKVIPEVCEKYQQPKSNGRRYCTRCSHGLECHR